MSAYTATENEHREAYLKGRIELADELLAVVEGFLAEHDRDPERMRWLPRLIEREQRKALDAAVQRVETLPQMTFYGGKFVRTGGRGLAGSCSGRCAACRLLSCQHQSGCRRTFCGRRP